MTPGAARPRRRRRQHRRRRHRADHRRHPRPRHQGPALRQPVRGPGAVGLDGRLHALDGVRPDRPGHHPGRRLRHLGHRVPGRPAADPRRASATSSLAGGSEAPIWPMGVAALVEHDRAVEAQRLAGDRLAAVRRDARRVRARRGRRGRGRRVARPRARARRDAIAEVIGGALTADAFHISAPEPTGRGQAMAMTKALRHAERRARTRSTTSSPTARPRQLNDVTETRAIKAAYGAHAYKVAISSPEVDDRPPRRRGRRRERARGASARSATRSSRRPRTCTPRTPSATSTTCRSPRDRRRSTRSPSTASASAARTRWRSSGASSTDEPPATEAYAPRTQGRRLGVGAVAWVTGGRDGRVAGAGPQAMAIRDASAGIRDADRLARARRAAARRGAPHRDDVRRRIPGPHRPPAVLHRHRAWAVGALAVVRAG